MIDSTHMSAPMPAASEGEAVMAAMLDAAPDAKINGASLAPRLGEIIQNPSNDGVSLLAPKVSEAPIPSTDPHGSKSRINRRLDLTITPKGRAYLVANGTAG